MSQQPSLRRVGTEYLDCVFFFSSPVEGGGVHRDRVRKYRGQTVYPTL